MAQLVRSVLTFKQIALWSISIVLGLLVWESGWPLSPELSSFLRELSGVCIIVYLCALVALVLSKDPTYTWKRLVFHGFLSVFILSILYQGKAIVSLYDTGMLDVLRLGLTSILVFTTIFSSISSFLKWLTLDPKSRRKENRQTYPPAFMFLVTLILLALIGGLLLLMPNCTNEDLSVMDAFFISVSAVCVTGLTPLNVAEVFTPLGQFIIMLLIQIGGFGVMTFAYFVSMVLGQGFSLRDRVLMRDLFNENALKNTTNFLQVIIFLTLFFELCGAAGLWWSWRDIELPAGSMPVVWHALFHSISAFNNAGFSTFTDGLCNGMVVQNRLGQAFIMMLIVSGGLGFLIYKEFYDHTKEKLLSKSKLRIHWSTHFKLTVLVTVVLIIGGMLILWGIEMTSHPRVLQEHWSTIMWQSLFNSISGRTAGFNINYVADYSAPAVLVLASLMIIGGSPGGTAGGVRTTTFAVVVAEVFRMVRGRKEVEFWGRTVARDVVDRSIATVVLCGIWIGVFTVISCYCQPEIEPMRLFFENVSAFGTVGLSLDVTGQLTETSKFFIIINMIAGRVGLFSFMVAIAGRSKPKYYRYPETRLPLN